MTKIQVIQVAILNHLYTYKKTKSYSDCINPAMFGIYRKIYDHILQNGEEPTTELFEYIAQSGLNEEFLSIMDPNYFSINCSEDIKKLLRYYYIDQHKDGEKIHNNLEEYLDLYDKATMLGIKNDSANYQVDNITQSLEKEISERGEGLLGYSTGIPTLDTNTQGLQKGTVLCLNGYSNIGKSKLSYSVCNTILKQYAKVVYFSLEVQRKILLGNLYANWFGVGYYDIMKGRVKPDFREFPMSQIEIVDDKYEMDQIEDYTETKKPDVIFIDFIQNIRCAGKSEYERMTEVAMRIQQLAIRNNIAVFDLSQVSNEGASYSSGSVIPSKGSGALVASSDVGLVLTKKQNETFVSLHIAKNKFGRNGIEIVLEPDFSRGTFIDKGELKVTNNRF